MSHSILIVDDDSTSCAVAADMISKMFEDGSRGFHHQTRNRGKAAGMHSENPRKGWNRG